MGSGAFLLAALDVLDPMYTTVMETAYQLRADGKGTAPFLAEAEEHTSDRYWMLRTACLNNLYGLDIMSEAVEIAKLRLFLKLAAELNDFTQIEPLPDLDFNIKSGNLLVGLADIDDANRRFATDHLPLADLGTAVTAAGLAATAYKHFIDSQSADTGDRADPDAKQQLETNIKIATTIADCVLHGLRAEQINLAEWRRTHNPFHWFAEFPAVWQHGGFDVIIGNPPYIAATKVKGYTWQGYEAQKCPDLYAVCVERASNLLNTRGCIAMIVMHSLCFGRRFESVRSFLTQRFSTIWVSSYAKIPDSLFSGSARVRNTIIVASNVGHPNLFTTRCRRWRTPGRPTLFST